MTLQFKFQLVPVTDDDQVEYVRWMLLMSSLDLPVMPPVAPMLAKAVARIPEGALSFELKWDGFRSIIFRDGDEVEIGSRNDKPMTR